MSEIAEMPERIWVTPVKYYVSGVGKIDQVFATKGAKPNADAIEYVRADLLSALSAKLADREREIAGLREALEAIEGDSSDPAAREIARSALTTADVGEG